MTKFRVFEEGKKSEEKEVFFRLINRNNEIALVACNKEGAEHLSGSIIGITSDGCLKRYGWIIKNVGLQLDDYLKIKVRE